MWSAKAQRSRRCEAPRVIRCRSGRDRITRPSLSRSVAFGDPPTGVSAPHIACFGPWPLACLSPASSPLAPRLSPASRQIHRPLFRERIAADDSPCSLCTANDEPMLLDRREPVARARRVEATDGPEHRGDPTLIDVDRAHRATYRPLLCRRRERIMNDDWREEDRDDEEHGAPIAARVTRAGPGRWDRAH